MLIKNRKEKILLNLFGFLIYYNINLSIFVIEWKIVSVCFFVLVLVMYIMFVISLIVLVVD